MFLYKKYLTNWVYYAYLTNEDMCDRGICGIWIGGFGENDYEAC
jgi:hypothetical protein